MIPVDCPICFDGSRCIGFTMVRKDKYEYKYHCTCRHGGPHKYEGRECTKIKTNYYCASIDTLPSGTIDEIIKDNAKRHGLRKAGDRWLKDPGPKLTDDETKQYKELAWQMMGVRL